MKSEVKRLSIHEALVYNSLYGFRVQTSKNDKNAQHYLYDIDNFEEKKPKEFTEEDLKPDEDDKKDFEFKVQSKYRKVSMHE